MRTAFSLVSASLLLMVGCDEIRAVNVNAGAAPTVDCRWSGEPADGMTDCALGDVLDVRVSSRDAERLRATQQPIRLYLDSRLVPDVVGYWDVGVAAAPVATADAGVSPDAATADASAAASEQVAADDAVPGNMMHFRLVRTEANRDLWGDLLGAPGGDWARVAAAVGAEGTVQMRVGEVGFVRAPHGNWILFFGVGLALVLLTLLLVFNSVLRDSREPTLGGKRAFSLGRTQMAWWTIQVLLAHTIVWAFTGAFDTLTTSVLTLIGISSGATLGAALIDASKTVMTPAERDALKAHADALQQSRAAEINRLQQDILATADPTTKAALQRQVDALQAPITDLKRRAEAYPAMYVAPASQRKVIGPLEDLVSDADGPVLHRVQMLLWTLLMTAFFWASVWRNMQMPDFDATWLALMGIASGVYLGFKVPERG